mmetsp:Transcript_3827/g.12119  ORF Transcript_3827/g.12119 Transcript_3827/m.12119 type:complete len:268 (+) Transcript_3827:771-1574(+)
MMRVCTSTSSTVGRTSTYVCSSSSSSSSSAAAASVRAWIACLSRAVDWNLAGMAVMGMRDLAAAAALSLLRVSRAACATDEALVAESCVVVAAFGTAGASSCIAASRSSASRRAMRRLRRSSLSTWQWIGLSMACDVLPVYRLMRMRTVSPGLMRPRGGSTSSSWSPYCSAECHSKRNVSRGWLFSRTIMRRCSVCCGTGPNRSTSSDRRSGSIGCLSVGTAGSGKTSRECMRWISLAVMRFGWYPSPPMVSVYVSPPSTEMGTCTS